MPALPRRRLLPVLLTAAALLVTSACARDVPLEPAPSASDPVCAQVLQTTPGVLGGAEQRPTTTQSSRAWGDPAITLRCGVEPLAPTTDRCIAVTGADGTTIDWVVAENDDVVGTGPDADTARGRFMFTTYGRTPAIEVIVPVEYAGTEATSLLVDLSSAVARTTQTNPCL
ncbi:DUF3515 family protein [Litorihabitans aurantiacus]|uniref:DUF3515 domain-containing protein n=1 Tax=Litorihabitans aurantiacus TaxID=1930061 RepID=A0AA37XBD1_9MICO|nr:DUF3515 family protein [Litorihabitans aurantiacus]GMA30839.1 hypothetical protein GCM10025875_08310 [Litorihabitans aurantiacus]